MNEHLPLWILPAWPIANLAIGCSLLLGIPSKLNYTRECWTYYTETTTPLLTLFAYGMAATAVWRVTEMAQRYARLWAKYQKQRY